MRIIERFVTLDLERQEYIHEIFPDTGGGQRRVADSDRRVDDRTGGLEPTLNTAGGGVGGGRGDRGIRRSRQPAGAGAAGLQSSELLHDTDDESSLGKAVSHGSIRVSNDVAVELGRQVMEAGGASRAESWYREARRNTNEHREVRIPNPVPIRVVPDG